MIIKDPIQPELNGKIKIWEFGKKLYEKFDSVVNPTEEDIEMGAERLNIWHPLDGGNVKLVMKKVGDFYNYDSSNDRNGCYTTKI